MIKHYLEQLRQGEGVRSCLIALRAEIKEHELEREWAGYFRSEEVRNLFLDRLLKDEDAKVRKNAALLIGAAGDNDCLTALYAAYEDERQMFVKSSYLSAMDCLNYLPVIERLKNRAGQLKKELAQLENKKHAEEELRELNAMLLAVDRPKPHRMKPGCGPFELILTTNRNHIHVTAEKLKGMPVKQIPAGLMVQAESLENIMEIRTFRELYFIVDGMRSCGPDPAAAANAIAGGENRLLQFLDSCHEGDAPYYFRLEVKNGMEPEKRAALIKRLASLIESESGYTLVNTPSFYELEIRLIETKEGTYNILIRLYTLRDTRFAYRRNVVAASIHPVNAALTAALAESWMKQDAQILDPFCGVGTMLIERAKLVRAGTMYGIDSFGEAVKGARENTKVAGEIINYINRDFFDFKHDYLFDEIITDMPWTKKSSEKRAIEDIYRQFFGKAPGLLKEKGVIILYTHDRRFVRLYMGSRLKLEKEYEISMKEEAYVMILTVR